MVRAGADVIKVATSGGVLSPRDDPRHAHFREDELEVLVTEATAAGIFVMAHAQATDGIKNAVRAGIRSIEHGIYLDDEAIDLMLSHGTWLVPTLVAPRGVIAAAEAGRRIPEASLQKARQVIDIHRESFRKAVAAGVKIAMGTDSAVTAARREPQGDRADGRGRDDACPGAGRHDLVGGRARGVDDQLGTIEPGKLADLTIVTGDALDVAPFRTASRPYGWRENGSTEPLSCGGGRTGGGGAWRRPMRRGRARRGPPARSLSSPGCSSLVRWSRSSLPVWASSYPGPRSHRTVTSAISSGCLTLVMVVLALVARLPRAMILGSALLLVLFALQSVFVAVRASTPVVAALHPVNGFLILLVSVWLGTRARSHVPQPLGTARRLDEGRSA